LSYVQERLADVWKENVMKDLESGSLSYTIVGEFLLDLKKKFKEEGNKTVKMAELKKIEQEGKTIDEFVQEFKRAARGSKYKESPLVKKFK